MKKRILPLVIAVILLAGLVYFSNPVEIVKTLSRIEISFLLFAVILWGGTHLVKVWRWQTLLRENNVRIGFSEALRIFTAGGFISNITPAKLGEPLRSLILKKSKGVRVSSTIPSIFFERVFDIVALILLSSLLSVLFFTKLLADIQSWLLFSIGVYTVFIIVAVMVLLSKKWTISFMSKIQVIFSFLPKIKEVNNRLVGFAENFHQSFSMYKSKVLYLKVLFASLVIWIGESLIFFLIFLSFGFNVDSMTLLQATLFFVPVVTLISVLTLLPGGIGSSEIITVLYFSPIFSLSFAEVTSVALVARIPTFWVSTFLGAYLFSKMKYKYKL